MQRVSMTVAVLASAAMAVAGPASGQHSGAAQQHPMHVVTVAADGGSLELRSSTGDAEQVTHLRQHLQQLTEALSTGRLDSPAAAQLQCVPGAAAMVAQRASITYVYADLPTGAELRMLTGHPLALGAIREFLSYHAEHHAADGREHGAHGAGHGADHGAAINARHGAGHGAGHACMPHSAGHTGDRQHTAGHSGGR